MMRVGAREECSRLWGCSRFRGIPVFDETLRTKVCCRLKTTKILMVESIITVLQDPAVLQMASNSLTQTTEKSRYPTINRVSSLPSGATARHEMPAFPIALAVTAPRGRFPLLRQYP
jgi:hypothetical protein